MGEKIQMLKKALEKDPNNPLGLYGLAMEYYKQGDYENAIKYLEKYLSIHEDEGAGYRTLAQCYVSLGDIESAIDAYEKGIQAAAKYNHPTMVAEFQQEIETLKSMI